MKKIFLRKSMVKAIEALQKEGSEDSRKMFYGAINFSLKDATVEVGKTKTFVMSAEIRDRHGDLVVLKGGKLDNYNRNPVVLSMHASSRDWRDTQPFDWDNVLGKGKAYMKGGLLLNDIDFEPKDLNPKAYKVERKIQFGSVNAGSIGFMPLKGHWGVEDDGEDTGTYYITEWELWEFSIVVIGSNPEALVVTGDDKKEAGQASSKKETQEAKVPTEAKNKGVTAVRLARRKFSNN